MSPSDLQILIDKNRDWAAQVVARDPQFFRNLSQQQRPAYLWIGCADSRIPATQVTGMAPGEIFVHRNVANVVVHTDLNCLSVIQYAVEVLRVKTIVVCGHYGCGGVHAALHDASHGLIDNWLRHIQDVAEKYREPLAAIEDRAARWDRLCELNVIEQVVNVCQTTVLQQAWRRGQEVSVHGCIYGVHDGLLRDLEVSISGAAEIMPRFRQAVALLETPSPLRSPTS